MAKKKQAKTKQKEPKSSFLTRFPLLKHLFYMVLLVVVLVFSAQFWLDSYTFHGEKEIVPNVKTLDLVTAKNLLEAKFMTYEVVDSLYTKSVPPGYIVVQDPAAGAMVKRNRKIYLITNALAEQMETVPSVIDVSLRQAKAMLEASGFVVEEMVYKPSDYRDLVLSVRYNNKELKPLSEVPAASNLSLWVGDGNLSPAELKALELVDEEVLADSIQEEDLEQLLLN